jgi:gluconate 2-dehydrogenase gamma chain
MPNYSTDRRGALKIIGAIGATCAYPFSGNELFGQSAEHHHAASAAANAAGSKPTFFGEADFKTLSRLADLIIPETETPGASGAGVPEYIDYVVARTGWQQSLMADGLRWLDEESERGSGKKFIALTEAQQLALVEPLCELADKSEGNARNVQFFALVKALTMDGYYTSRVGLIEELGYKGNMAVAGFAECKEH